MQIELKKISENPSVYAVFSMFVLLYHIPLYGVQYLLLSYIKTPCLTDLTVSICKTRRFILYLCTLKNNPLLCSYLIRQINVFRLLRIHYFYYFVCPTTLQNIKNIFIGIFYHKFCLCFLQYSHSSNDKSESRGIHKIKL